MLKILWVVAGFFLGLQAFAVEGSTYFLRQNFSLPQGVTCSESLDRMSRVLFGEKDEFRRLTFFSSVRCELQNPKPLAVEVLFEPEFEGDRAAVEERIETLRGLDWNTEGFNFYYVNGIFWNIYGYAMKANGSLVGGFEKPRVAADFAFILRAKNQIKKALLSPAVSDFHHVLEGQIGADDFSKWKKEVLPLTKKFETAFYMYVLTSGEDAQRVSLVYQLGRDCEALGCL